MASRQASVPSSYHNGMFVHKLDTSMAANIALLQIRVFSKREIR